MKDNRTFTCPVCGSTVKRNASACPDCGADDRTGWSDLTYLDGIDIGDDIDYDDLADREFPSERPPKKPRRVWVIIVSGILLFVFLAGLLKIIL